MRLPDSFGARILVIDKARHGEMESEGQADHVFTR
jgi:hypothetical protein